ncbi:rRNA pseudouridine synthase [Candidatus Peregrinibacteria bacterium]|nr:rRNA pseudouridine synthase [Candidatus Peregrinibacteria bacterium]
MRINKFISSNSEYSRRKADELIENGDVKLNGKIIKKLGTEIDETKDLIEVKGKPIKANNEKLYIALNKPSGYVTSRNDEQNRKTVMELVPKNKNLKPVGRLDLNTEGLLLLSNDGDFINKLTHPKYECEKEYYVTIEGELTPREKKRLEQGILIEGKRTSKAFLKITESSKSETFLRIVIHEGRKRQIRKMFASVNHPVKYLQRVRIGQIKLGTLKKGSYRLLTNQEINVY